jgi:hypothetical protein
MIPIGRISVHMLPCSYGNAQPVRKCHISRYQYILMPSLQLIINQWLFWQWIQSDLYHVIGMETNTS